MILKISAYETEFDYDRDKPHMEETYFHESLDDMIEAFANFLEDIGLIDGDLDE